MYTHFILELLCCRYRKYSLKDGSGLIVRCQHDAVLPPSSSSSSPDQFINIKTLNEWDPKVNYMLLAIMTLAMTMLSII